MVGSRSRFPQELVDGGKDRFGCLPPAGERGFRQDNVPCDQRNAAVRRRRLDGENE
jgi:hypothetical protein